jgi:hypothetical protein
MEPSNAEYPASFTLDPPEKVANWRPLVNWILAIPHYVVLYALRILSQVVGVISWFAILFTGKLPDSFANIQAMYMRYEQRVYSFSVFMREEYPPFAFNMSPTDDGADPRTTVNVQPQLEDRNRVTVAFRLILAIPQLIVLTFLGIGAAVVIVIAFFAVLFTGSWPEGMRTYVINVVRWYVRVEAYTLLLNDEYPPFAFV